MSLTFSAFLFVPLAVWAAFRTSRTMALLAGTVGFSSTAIVNIDALRFGVQPYHLFGLLLITRALLEARVKRTERKRRRVTWILYGLAAFWVACFISVMAADPKEATRFYMISQLLHLGFGIGVCWAVSRVVRTPGTLRVACRGYERGAVFIAAWGIMQFVMYRTGAQYPDYFFNTSIGLNANLGGGELFEGVIRAGSVATEPSFLGRTLNIALGLMMVRHARGSLKERRWLVAGALVIIVSLFTATSTTGFFGLAVLLGVGLVAGRKLRVQRFAALAAVTAALVPVLSPALMEAVVAMTAGKVGTYSYEGRTQSMEVGQATFGEHPWFGIGWGNLTVHDLPFKVLSNAGGIAAACLVVVLFGLLVGRVRPEHAGRLRPELRGLKLAVVLSVAMDWVAGYSYPYGDIWLISGLLLAAMTLGPATAPAPGPATVDLDELEPAPGDTVPHAVPAPALA